MAGDLNCAVAPKDRCFLHRGLDASRLKQAAQLITDAKAKSMIEQAAEAWPAVRDALRNRTVVACSTANSRTGETFSKFRCRAIHTKTGRRGPAVARETSESYASSSYEVDGVGVESDGEVSPGLDAGRFLVRGPNCLTGACLREALTKLSGVALSADHLKLAAASGALDPPQDAPTAFGAAPVSSQAWSGASSGTASSTHWTRCILSGRIASRAGTSIPIEGTTTRARASTTDCRRGLVAFIEPRRRDAGYGTKGRQRPGRVHARRPLAAAGFDGSGIRDGRAEDYTYHTSRPPHTGIIYTPPTWSDHVAVSLLLTRVPVSTEKAPKKVAATRSPTRGSRASRPSSRRARRRGAGAPPHATSREEVQEDDPQALRRQKQLDYL